MYSFKHEHKLAIKDRAPETREAILFADIKTKCEDTENEPSATVAWATPDQRKGA
jgi:hypothetical protein